jgi:hypothetical protein
MLADFLDRGQRGQTEGGFLAHLSSFSILLEHENEAFRDYRGVLQHYFAIGCSALHLGCFGRPSGKSANSIHYLTRKQGLAYFR